MASSSCWSCSLDLFAVQNQCRHTKIHLDHLLLQQHHLVRVKAIDENTLKSHCCITEEKESSEGNETCQRCDKIQHESQNPRKYGNMTGLCVSQIILVIDNWPD